MKLYRELIFWVITIIVLTLGFGLHFHDFIGAFYFVILLMPVIVGTSYVFSRYLVLKLLMQKRYFTFTLHTVYTIIISLNLEMIVIILAFALLANYRFDQLLPASKDVFGLAITMYFVALLKSFEVLIRRSLLSQEKLAELQEKEALESKSYIVVKSDRKNVRIDLAKLNYIESLADYVKLHLDDNSTIITKEKISQIEKLLPQSFLRIHRSFIINTDKMKQFTAEKIHINEQELPIGRKYKTEVQQKLNPEPA